MQILFLLSLLDKEKDLIKQETNPNTKGINNEMPKVIKVFFKTKKWVFLKIEKKHAEYIQINIKLNKLKTKNKQHFIVTIVNVFLIFSVLTVSFSSLNDTTSFSVNTNNINKFLIINDNIVIIIGLLI